MKLDALWIPACAGMTHVRFCFIELTAPLFFRFCYSDEEFLLTEKEEKSANS